MAEKKEETKTVLERTYTVPLRKEWLKKAPYKRAKKAVTGLKKFLLKHMKGTEVKVGKIVNDFIWKHGIKNPPHKVKVTATKDDKGVVKTELFGHKYEEKKKEAKVEKSKLDEAKEKLLGKETVKKVEAEAKEAAKEDKKEEKKPAKKPAAKKVPSAHELAEKKKTSK
ncbi:50S ribosomal protein L31e [Nanoarchaeota archaeon]